MRMALPHLTRKKEKSCGEGASTMALKWSSEEHVNSAHKRRLGHAAATFLTRIIYADATGLGPGGVVSAGMATHCDGLCE